jgi:hypothetical protein
MTYLTYVIYLKFYFYHCVLCDEVNKNRSQLHIYFLKKLTRRCFKYSLSNSSNRIYRVNFLHFLAQ